MLITLPAMLRGEKVAQKYAHGCDAKSGGTLTERRAEGRHGATFPLSPVLRLQCHGVPWRSWGRK